MTFEAIGREEMPKFEGQAAEKSTKGEIKKARRINNILVIAPHGVPQDDKNTDLITRQLAENLECCSVVNDVYRKPKKRKDKTTRQIEYEQPDKDKKIVNANRRNQVEQHLDQEFLQPILAHTQTIIDGYGKALVVWIHGIADGNIKAEAKDMRANEDIHLLIGIGQGVPDRFTAYNETADELIELLKRNQKKPITACRAKKGSDYCGWHPNIMNQLFRQDRYDLSEVQSIQVEIKYKGFRDTDENIENTAKALTEALSALVQAEPEKADMAAPLPVAKSAPLKKVKLDDIVVGKPNDGQYIFRVTSDDEDVKKRQEAEIQELADSIEKNGLVHPLVLIQNGDGKYRILCGFRRFQALKHLKKEWVEARIYQENDLTEQQRIRISLAENARRRNLNPIEIGAFLEAARGNGKNPKTLKDLGEEFGELLGIGTTHGSVNKYLKLNEIRVKGESQDIINDVLKGQLAFGVAAEVLAFIDNAEDRNELYKQIVKPLKPTRPELAEVKKCLVQLKNGNGLKSTLATEDVQEAIGKAQQSAHKGQELLKLLKPLIDDPLTKQKDVFDDTVDALRHSVFGEDATEEAFNVIPPPDMEKNEITVHFKVTDKDFDATVDNVKKLLDAEDFRKLLDSVVSP